MYQQTHLCRRKEAKFYYFRIRIPVYLEWYYGKSEIKRSLKTTDIREAKRRARQLTLEFQDEFDRVRRQIEESKIQPELVLDGSEASINSICQYWKYHTLAGDETFRIENPDDSELAEHIQNRREVQSLLQEALVKGKLEIIEPAFRQFLYLLRVSLDCNEAEYQRFLYRFCQTLAETNELQLNRNDGRVVPTPPVPEFRLTMDDLFLGWKKLYRGGRQKTVDRVNSIIRDLKSCVGNKPAESITKADIKKFRDHLLDRNGDDPKTVSTKISLLRAVFQIAVDDDLLTKNPASRIRIPKSGKRKKRLPFELAELNLFAE